MKIKFLCSAAVISILGSELLAAQQATDSGGLQEIVVTAQRRTENVQQSSLAIDVVGADQLAQRGVSEARDLTSVNPSISISQAGAFTQTNIRGAGDPSLNGLRQTAVSYSVDGVVIGQPVGISQNFYDLARVEILKGPQGTLYGRNATGGAVNLITQRPTHELGGYLTAEYGNFASKKATGALNVPLTSTLAVRGAFDVVDRHGYLSDGTDDDVRQSGRLQAYWEPSDAFNLRVFGDYSHTGGKGGGAVLFATQPGTNSWTSVTDPINNAAVAAGTGGLHSVFSPDASMDLHQWDVAAEMNLALGDFATLTAIPAYRHSNFDAISNTFGFRSQFYPQTSKQTSYEVRLGHQSELIKWTVGGYYFNDDTRFDLNTYPLTPFAATLIPNFNTRGDVSSLNRSTAAFGEATYSVTKQLRVIGGLRHTHDLVSYAGGYGDQRFPLIPQSGEKRFDAQTWKAGAEYDIAAQSMAFVTVSRGYKSGGFFFVPDLSGDNNYKPEFLTAVEAGVRNRFFDNRLQVNLEAFYWRYKDQQLSSVGFTSAGSIAYLTRNAGSSTPRGGSLDVVWKLTQADTLGFAVNYTRARFDTFTINYPAPIAFTLRTGPLCSVPASPTVGPGGLPVLAVTCAGAPLPRTPEWSGSVNHEHVFQLGGAGEIASHVGVTWATSRYLSPDFFIPETRDGGYALLNADLTYTPEKGSWSVTAFARNLTDKAVYQGAIADVLNGFAGPSAPTFVERQAGEPRVYGVRGTFRF